MELQNFYRHPLIIWPINMVNMMYPAALQLLTLFAKGRSQSPFQKIIEAVGLGLSILIFIVVFLIEMLILSVIIYFAGLMIVGGRKATFGDAFKISLLGTVLGGLIYGVVSIFAPLIGWVIYILIWLALIKQYFETGWLNALAIGILAVIVALALFILMGLFTVGLALLLDLLKDLFKVFV